MIASEVKEEGRATVVANQYQNIQPDSNSELEATAM